MALELPYGMQWITEMTIAMIVLLIVLLMFVSSQNSISTTINDNQPEQYQKAIVMENLLSHEADYQDLHTVEDYDEESLFYNRRGYLPIDYFTQLGSNIHYSQNNGHCYVENSGEPIVPLLDGERYAYLIEPLPGIDEYAHVGDPDYTVSDTDCSISSLGDGSNPDNLPQDHFKSTALLRRDEGGATLPVRLYIYGVES